MIVHKYWLKLRYGLLVTIAFNLAITMGYSQPRFSIVATTSMLGDAIQQIVQEKATVITLMGPGIDPHVYKASPRDIKNLSEANLVFYNGLHLEGKMTDVLRSFSKKKPVYAASDGIDPTQYLRDPSFAESIDPHIWFDVALWKQVVTYISKQIQNLDPSNAACYQANADSYNKKLDELDQMIRQAIQQIPPIQRVLITAHDAFGYFGRAYQIEVKGLQGISTVEECGLRDIANLVAFIIHRKIKAIFPESSVIDKPLRAVVQGCQKRGHDVILGPELYSDALGQGNTWAGTYIGMITTNVQNIVNALK
jgi:manganese/zinc/iron transport system substrate-binding protein